MTRDIHSPSRHTLLSLSFCQTFTYLLNLLWLSVLFYTCPHSFLPHIEGCIVLPVSTESYVTTTCRHSVSAQLTEKWKCDLQHSVIAQYYDSSSLCLRLPRFTGIWHLHTVCRDYQEWCNDQKKILTQEWENVFELTHRQKNKNANNISMQKRCTERAFQGTQLKCQLLKQMDRMVTKEWKKRVKNGTYNLFSDKLNIVSI